MKIRFSSDTFFKLISSLAAIILIVAIVIKLIPSSPLSEVKLETLLILLVVIIILPYISQLEAFGVKVEVKKRLEDLTAEVKALPDYVIGSEYLAENDYILAEESFRKSLEKSPNFWPAILGIAGIYHEREEYDKAIREYNRVLKIDPQTVYALNNLAEVYILAPTPIRSPQKAIEMADQALKIIPSLWSALYYKCEALNRLGHYEEAGDVLRGMLEKNLLASQSHWVMYELAIANSNLGKNLSDEYLDDIFFHAKDNDSGVHFLKVISEKEEQERFKESDRSVITRLVDKNKNYIEASKKE